MMRRYLCFAVSLVRRSATSRGVPDLAILKSRDASHIGCHLLQISVVRSQSSVVSSDAHGYPGISLLTTDYRLRTTDQVPMPYYDAIVIGGGPAGSSAAISLVNRGARVLLLEATSMPRGKLCGEFITPESFPTLERLGVMQRMLSDGAHRITRASLVASNGNSVQADLSRISANASWAMSLSRSRFDQNLFDRAREAGVECREGVAVKSCTRAGGLSHEVEALSLAKGSKVVFRATVIVDAS